MYIFGDIYDRPLQVWFRKKQLIGYGFVFCSEQSILLINNMIRYCFIYKCMCMCVNTDDFEIHFFRQQKHATYSQDQS